MSGPPLPSDRANIGTVANPTEKRYRAESLLKGNAQNSACPEMNCQAMKPKKLSTLMIQIVKAGEHKELQKNNRDSRSGKENRSECTSHRDMVRDFKEFDSHGESCSDNEPVDSHFIQLLKGIVSCMSAAELRLLGGVNYVTENKENMVVNRSNSYLCREVMKHLKELGYNAGICKSLRVKTRDSSIPLGDYEYMDVIMERSEGKSKEERLLVDIDFRAQFEIARPTKQYSTMVGLLPNVFVGKAEKLKKIIKLMCYAAVRSLKKKAMHIPPWREYSYVRSKWFRYYKRTINPAADSISSGPVKPAEPPQQKGFEINFHRRALEEGKLPLGNVEAKKPAMNKGGKVSGLTTAFKREGLANSSSKVQLIR